MINVLNKPTEETMLRIAEATERIAFTQVKGKIYSVVIDENNSNPVTSVTYSDAALGMTPARGNNGSFDWGSWEDIIKNEFGIKPCVLSNPTMNVNYYLNYNDLTKKENNTASVLDGTDGDVMIEFSKPLYWSFSKLDGKISVRLSAFPFVGGKRYAFDTESGYNQLHIYHLTLTQILYLLMFKSLDSQTALGRGYVDGNTEYTNTGAINDKSFCFGETTGKVNMKFLGMEDLWGNRRQWNDGCFYDTDGNILIGLSNFNNEATGYTNMGHSGLSSDSAGYINSVQGGDTTGFIPRLMSGSATTRYCDYGNLYAGRVPTSGGYLSDASVAGAFYLNSTTVSFAYATIGGRLVAKKGDKLYIGAYLGVSSGGKLRSISGQVSHNNATMGAFRTLARANNV